MVGKNWETKENTKQRCHGVISSKRLSELTDIILSPEGTLRVADTEGGPIVFYLCLISVRKRILDFQNPLT